MPVSPAKTGRLRGNSPWDTLRQSILRLGTMLPHLQPTWHAESIAELTPAFLARQQVRGIIWDVDGTLMPHHGERVPLPLTAAFEALLAEPSLRHVILSNSPSDRFLVLGTLFPTIPVLRMYALDGDLVPHRLEGDSHSLTAAEREALQARGAMALRKPNEHLVRYALRMLECEAHEAVMVGDQLLTDIAGASLAGVRTIKVATWEPSSFPRTVRLAQRVEPILHAVRFGSAPSREGPVRAEADIVPSS